MKRLFHCVGRRRTTRLMSGTSDATRDCCSDVAYTILPTSTEVISSTSEPDDSTSMSLAPATMGAVELPDAESKVSDSDAGTTECAEPEATVAAVAESAVDVTVGVDNAVSNAETAYQKIASPRCTRHDLQFPKSLDYFNYVFIVM